MRKTDSTVHANDRLSSENMEPYITATHFFPLTSMFYKHQFILFLDTHLTGKFSNILQSYKDRQIHPS